MVNSGYKLVVSYHSCLSFGLHTEAPGFYPPGFSQRYLAALVSAWQILAAHAIARSIRRASDGRETAADGGGSGTRRYSSEISAQVSVGGLSAQAGFSAAKCGVGMLVRIRRPPGERCRDRRQHMTDPPPPGHFRLRTPCGVRRRRRATLGKPVTLLVAVLRFMRCSCFGALLVVIVGPSCDYDRPAPSMVRSCTLRMAQSTRRSDQTNPKSARAWSSGSRMALELWRRGIQQRPRQ